MRRHLTERDATHHRAARNKQRLVERMAQPMDAKSRRALHREHEEAERLREQAEAMGGEWECSLCHRQQAEGKHISVQISGILAHRGKAKRKKSDPLIAEGKFYDLPPLVKDYPADKRPYLYCCQRCAIRVGIVTREELAAGLRRDNLDEDE